MKLAPRPSLMLVLVAVLLALVPLLAVLQYRWLGQVSEGEREIMRANLRAAAARFGQDFDRELTRAYLAFQMSAEVAQAEQEHNYARRYELWMATAPHPKLIREIFLAQPKAGQFQLEHFNREGKHFELSEWPHTLSGLRLRLERHQQLANSDLATSLRGVVEQLGQAGSDADKVQVRRSTVVSTTLSPLLEDVPALLIPVMPIRPAQRAPRLSGSELSARSLGQMLMVQMPQSYLILTLDLDYIQREFVPSLINNQEFFSGDKSNYNLAVISRGEPRKIIYQSGTPLPLESWATSDAAAKLGGVRMDEISDLLRDSPARAGAEPESNILHPDRFAISVLSSSSLAARLPKLPSSDDSRPWELIIKHRAGSLEAAVARVRRKNLLISFGVLLLLGLSVGLLVISTRRAQHLARQQMEFVSAVTHELRTPLSVIRSAGENLADGVIDERGQVQRYGALIAGEGRRLTEMVEQVLEFAGAQSGRKTYELRPVEASAVIESALAACRPQIIEGGFHIELDLPAHLPLIKADTAALRHAIQNLLSNAMKYSGESQWIGVRVREEINQSSSELQITIEDHGLGIAPAELPHIFEPFYRGREVVAAQIHGNGLGLSLVKRIVEAHGGSVSVESTPGRGSSFMLRLPAVAHTDEMRAELKSAIGTQY
jgi:signal transduction histidine kinase